MKQTTVFKNAEISKIFFPEIKVLIDLNEQVPQNKIYIVINQTQTLYDQLLCANLFEPCSAVTYLN